MFDLEIIELLKKLKNTSEEYESKKIKKSICNLIKENPSKYEHFIQMQALDRENIMKNGLKYIIKMKKFQIIKMKK